MTDPRQLKPACEHRGPSLRTVACPTCPGGKAKGVQIKVFDCDRFGEVTLQKEVHGRPTCQACLIPHQAPLPDDSDVTFVRGPKWTIGQNYHRSGWPYAADGLRRHLAGMKLDVPILFDDFVEQSFCYNGAPKPHLEPWVGIFHHPPEQPSFGNRSEALEVMMASRAFKQSKPHLKLAITLSHHLAEFLKERLPCPVYTAKHPSGIPDMGWRPKLFREREGSVRLLQVGWYLRNTRAIFQVPALANIRRVRIIQKRPHITDYDHRVKRYWEDNGTREEYPDVIDRSYVNNEEYDALFSDSVILTELFAASANNVVIECVARATPVVINRYPSVVEYLGDDYPLYFEDPRDVADIVGDADRVMAAHTHLHNMDKSWLSSDTFGLDIRNIIQRTNKNDAT